MAKSASRPPEVWWFTTIEKTRGSPDLGIA